MSLPQIRRVPRTAAEAQKYWFIHFLEHKRVLQVISAKTGSVELMPPIWPVLGVYDPQQAEFHQHLHQQMNALSKNNSSDFANMDLTQPAIFAEFVYLNYQDHFIFAKYVGS